MVKFYELELSDVSQIGNNIESTVKIPVVDEVKEDANNGVQVVAAQRGTHMKRKSVISNIPTVKRRGRLFLAPHVDVDQMNGVNPIEEAKVEKIQTELGDNKNPPTEKKSKRLFFLPPPLSMSLRERKAPVVLPIVSEPSHLRKKKKKPSQKKTSSSVVLSRESFADDYKPNGYVIANSLNPDEPFIMSLRKRKAMKIFDYSSDEESNVPTKKKVLKSLSKPAVVETKKFELSEYELEIKKNIEERKNIFKMLLIGDAKKDLTQALKK